jgi:predicted nucleotidyltransferase
LADLIAKIPQILEQIPYLKLLVLFGSRARGDHDPKSDWDFAFLCDEELHKQHAT